MRDSEQRTVALLEDWREQAHEGSRAAVSGLVTYLKRAEAGATPADAYKAAVDAYQTTKESGRYANDSYSG